MHQVPCRYHGLAGKRPRLPLPLYGRDSLDRPKKGARKTEVATALSGAIAAMLRTITVTWREWSPRFYSAHGSDQEVEPSGFVTTY
jgi:hypothetical protein